MHSCLRSGLAGRPDSQTPSQVRTERVPRILTAILPTYPPHGNTCPLTSVLRVRPRLIVEAGCDGTAGERKPKSSTYAEYKDGGESSIVPAALSFEAWPPSSGHQRKLNCTTDSAPYFACCEHCRQTQKHMQLSKIDRQCQCTPISLDG